MRNVELSVYHARTPVPVYAVWAGVAILDLATFAYHWGFAVAQIAVSLLWIGCGEIMRRDFGGTRRLRTTPFREPPTAFPVATRERQTVVGTLLATEPPVPCPSPAEGDIVAWSLDSYELEVGWSTISRPGTLLIEGADGARFTIELSHEWKAITSAQMRVAQPVTPQEMDEARERWASAMSHASPIETFAEPESAAFKELPTDFALYLRSWARIVQSLPARQRRRGLPSPRRHDRRLLAR